MSYLKRFLKYDYNMLKYQLLFFFLLLITYGLAQSELPKLNPDGIYESQFSKVEEEQLIGKVKEVKKKCYS